MTQYEAIKSILRLVKVNDKLSIQYHTNPRQTIEDAKAKFYNSMLIMVKYRNTQNAKLADTIRELALYLTGLKSLPISHASILVDVCYPAYLSAYMKTSRHLQLNYFFHVVVQACFPAVDFIIDGVNSVADNYQIFGFTDQEVDEKVLKNVGYIFPASRSEIELERAKYGLDCIEKVITIEKAPKNIYNINIINNIYKNNRFKDNEVIRFDNGGIQAKDIQPDNLFEELIKTLNNLAASKKEKQQLIEIANDMRQDQSSSRFIEKYFSFIEKAANHMTVLAPFIPMLTEILKNAIS